MAFRKHKNEPDELLEALNHKIRIGWIAVGLDEMDAEGAKNLRSHIHRAALNLKEAGRAGEAKAVLAAAKKPGSEGKEGAWNYILTTVIEHL